MPLVNWKNWPAAVFRTLASLPAAKGATFAACAAGQAKSDTLLDRGWIEAHIPHKDGMCLLDEVLTWDAVRIRCRSTSHRSSDNPLRADGRLGAACAIEYAAQAMAVHGALLAGDTGPRRGFLASVRNVTLHVDRLDDLDADLIAVAERVKGDERTMLYEFSVLSGERVLVSGRASIVCGGASGDSPQAMRNRE
jgi:predicted hotdog family 3-hydroxylacyl-ACP dehydratase